MASNVSLSEEDLSCPICFEEYNIDEDHRMPKLLLCLHTVCFTCLEYLISDDDMVRCPICRMDHQINEDLEDLLDNDAIVAHIRSKQEEANKKAALEIYWEEWLKKCSNEIPDEELRANIQDLVQNSLIPFEQQDLQRRAQEKQEQQRPVEQHRGGGHDSNWTEFLEGVSQFLNQLNVQYNNPRSPTSLTDRQSQQVNQDRQEAVERSQQPRQGEGHNQHSQDELEVPHQHMQDTGVEPQQHISFGGLVEYEYLAPSEEEEEEEVEDAGQEQEEEEVDDYNYDEEENYYTYDSEDWEDYFDNYDDSYSSNDDEVEIVGGSVEAQPQQQQLQQSLSNQTPAITGRKIIITGSTVNKYADTALIKSSFEVMYGPVSKIDIYTGTSQCPTSYAVMEFRRNVLFVPGEYQFGVQKFNATLCSGKEGRVFVARLPHGIDDDDIINYFRKFGDICSFYRPIHFGTRRPVTYCFLTFGEEYSAKEVLKYEDHYINDQRFMVKPHVNQP